MYLTADSLFEYVIIFSLIVLIVKSYIIFRQILFCNLSYKELKELIGEKYMDTFFEESVEKETKYKETVNYSIDKLIFEIVESTFDLITEVITFLFMDFVWKFSISASNYLESFSTSEWYFYIFYQIFNLTNLNVYGLEDVEYKYTFIFLDILSLVKIIIDLPFKYYKNFVIEQKYGFNKMTMSTFFTDIVKEFLISQLLMKIIYLPLIYIIKHYYNLFFIYGTVIIIVFQIIIVLITPYVIIPLFYKMTRLSEETKYSKLCDKIESLAVTNAFPIKDVMQMDSSSRSAHSNAFFIGLLGEKKIVLFDTLLQQCTEDEIVAVVCHEIGHFKYFHIQLNILVSTLIILCMLGLFQVISTQRIMFEAFGIGTYEYGVNGVPVLIALVIYMFYFKLLDVPMRLARNYMSRVFEFQADSYAINFNYGDLLINALSVLVKENKSMPHYDHAYSTLYHTHPPVIDRIKAIENQIKKQK